ncbi:Hypothetical predicted protein, partial [Paramuricea clavata]
GMEQVVMDIEKNLNWLLTYVEGETESKVLTPNVIMWGGNAYPLEELETDTDKLTSMNRQLINARQHAWQCWKREYIHALMERIGQKRKAGV